MPQFKKTKKIKTSEQRVVGCFHLWHGSRQGHRGNHSAKPSLRPTKFWASALLTSQQEPPMLLLVTQNLLRQCILEKFLAFRDKQDDLSWMDG